MPNKLGRTPLLLVAMCLGCSAHSAPVDDRRTPAPNASGVVVDASGAVVRGATIAFREDGKEEPIWVGSSDDRGSFRLPFDIASKKDLSATASSRDKGYVHIPARSGWVAPATLKLEVDKNSIRVRGRVEDHLGAPRENVLVEAYRISEIESDVFYTRTARDGSFVASLPRGDYQLKVFSKNLVSDTLGFPPSRESAVELTAYAKSDVLAKPGESVTSGFIGNATPLTAAAPFPDILERRLDERNVRILGLGEATHGTHEFQALRIALAKELMTRGLFDLFVIEAEVAAARRLNEYVLNGKGDPAGLLAGMGFWIWDTEELLEFVRWMRTLNKSRAGSRKVQFFGIDAQSPQSAAASVLEAVRTFLPDDPNATDLLSKLQGDDGRRVIAAMSDEEAASALDLLESVSERLSHVEKESPEVAFLRFDVRSLQQSIRLGKKTTVIEKTFLRDRQMADNILWLARKFPSSRLLYWAHNGHVAKRESNYSYSAGIHLERELGQRYYAIGLSFLKGEFRTRLGFERGKGVINHRLSEPPEHFVERAFPVRSAPLFIDATVVAKNEATRRWLSVARYKRDVGAVYYNEDFYKPIRLFEVYDAVIHVSEMTPTQPTPTGRRPPGK